jgi:signal transduction histidine kinase
MIRRLDTLIAYGRWLALLGIPLVASLTLSFDPESIIWAILVVILVMAVLDAFPVGLLYFKLFPDWVALVFSVLDGVFSLIMLYLGGIGMFFYCFVPALALSIRFDWAMGLIGAAVLAVGHVLIALAKIRFVNVSSVLELTLVQSLSLLLASALSGLLADSIKREPPLNAKELRARNEELYRLQRAVDRAHAIYRMAITLGATLDPQKILDAVLEVSTVGFEELTEQGTRFGERPAGIVFLYGANGLYVAASRNISYEERDLTVSGRQGALDRVLRSAEPLLLDSLAGDPDLKQFAVFRRCHSAVCVPLLAGFELYGVVVFASPVSGSFTKEHIELLVAVANQAAVALNNAQLYSDLQEEKERIIEVEGEERTKLARDLHDGPTQSVSAIAMRLNFARLLLDREPLKVKDELFKLENLARRTTKEIRTMLFALRPIVLETQGLKVAVEQFVEKIKEAGDLPVTLELAEVEDQLDTNIKAVAWFIVQEALSNARKHAEADNIWVRMYIQDERFITEIEDDGEGFDYEATMANYDQRGSFGLLNLQERADLVNGRTTIQSAIGQGTKVTLVIPLNREGI